MEKKHVTPTIYGVSAVLLWSTVATAFKLTLASIHPLQLVFLAATVSTIFFSLVLICQKRFSLMFSYSPMAYLKSAFLGFLNPYLYYTLLFTAYARLLGQEALALNYTWPIVLVLLSVPVLKQKLHPVSIVALCISFSGVIVIASRGNFHMFHLSDPIGISFAIGSSLIWASYWLGNMRDKRDRVVKLCQSFFFGTIYALITVFIMVPFPSFHWTTVAGVSYIGLFEMGVTFLLWFTALERATSPALISNLVYISPFLSLLFLRIIIGEHLLVSTFVGLTLIVVGILIQKRTN